MNAIHFGAGNIGRGFIGILLKNSNYNITFVDLNKDIINSLKANNEYTIKYLDEDNSTDTVKDVQALHGAEDYVQVIDQISSCDLITTSLGQDNLKYIAENIALGIAKRTEIGNNKAMDIIACENGLAVSSFFKQLILDKLTTEQKQYVDKYVGFVDCTVDRIVPNQVNENICDVQVEPGFEWVLKADQVKANSMISDAKYSNDLAYYNKRKLLSVNLTHSLIGYIGHLKGYTYVHETIAIPEVEQFVTAVLKDIRNSLVCEFGVSVHLQDEYAAKTIKRFKNDKIVDELTRVARNPLTKLGNDERYVSPLKVLVENNLDYEYIGQAIAYALSYTNKDEEQSVRMQEIIANNTIEEAISNITGLEDELVIQTIANKYKQLNK